MDRPGWLGPTGMGVVDWRGAWCHGRGQACHVGADDPVVAAHVAVFLVPSPLWQEHPSESHATVVRRRGTMVVSHPAGRAGPEPPVGRRDADANAAAGPERARDCGDGGRPLRPPSAISLPLDYGRPVVCGLRAAGRRLARPPQPSRRPHFHRLHARAVPSSPHPSCIADTTMDVASRRVPLAHRRRISAESSPYVSLDPIQPSRSLQARLRLKCSPYY